MLTVNSRAVGTKVEGSLNLLSKKEARRLLKDVDAKCILFYIRKVEEAARPAKGRLAKLLAKYVDVFLEELPKELPPERAFLYYIDTGSAVPVNLNAYPLLYEKLEELRR